MLTEVILPAFTAIGSAAIASYLARAQNNADYLEKIEKLKTSLERQKQRNRLLGSELELARTKIQLEGALRSLEAATSRAPLAQDLSALVERSLTGTFRQSAGSAFFEAQEPIETRLLPSKTRRRIAGRSSAAGF